MKKIIFYSIFIGVIGNINSQVILENSFQNLVSPNLGAFQSINFREGGFSGLSYIPNTNGTEFWTVTDRGVNIAATNANSAAATSLQYPIGCIPTYDKIYAFPGYAPKIIRLKIVGNEVQILETISIKRPNGTDASGLLNPAGYGSATTEIMSTNVVTDCANFNANTISKDAWGLDSEGIDVDNQGNFWICEEGGPTIWKVNSDGVVLKRYTPYNLIYPEDCAIDSCFGFRRNNRGFEGITIAPNGKVYAIIQSPIYYGNIANVASNKTLGNSRIHRILEIDPSTNAQKMYAYVNDGQIGTSNDIRPRDQKIGDIKAINNTTFLVIEQSSRGVQNMKKLYKIDISLASQVYVGLSYDSNSKTLEELENAANLGTNNITPVTKSLVFDLLANSWPLTVEKAEGLAIVDANTIIICNDNDFGQYSAQENGIASLNNENSTFFKYTLNGPNVLQNYIPTNNQILTNSLYAKKQNILVYPNPFKDNILVSNVADLEQYFIFNALGTEIITGRLVDKTISLATLKSGVYLLKIANKIIKIVKI